MASEYADLNVYDIYKMSKKDLKEALTLAKQSTRGNKRVLRNRFIFFRGIVEIPSDAESCESENELIVQKKINVTKSKGKHRKRTRQHKNDECDSGAAAAATNSPAKDDSQDSDYAPSKKQKQKIRKKKEQKVKSYFHILTTYDYI